MRKRVGDGRERLSFPGIRFKYSLMKSLHSTLVVVALAMIGLPFAAHAELSAYRLRVEQVSKSDNEKFSKKQQRGLKIFVSNSSKEAAELRAKYIFFGKQANHNEVVKIDEGEKTVSVGPLGTQMVETEMATATSQEEHMTSAPGGKGKSGGNKAGGNKAAPAKKVEASGSKITGFGVQLFKGETMVAEYYDPPSGKEEWTKADPLKLPAAPKKK